MCRPFKKIKNKKMKKPNTIRQLFLTFNNVYLPHLKGTLLQIIVYLSFANQIRAGGIHKH